MVKTSKIIFCIISMAYCSPFTTGQAKEQKRAMTFLDVIQMRSSRQPDISPDGKWFVYTIRTPDWVKNRWFTNIYITPLTDGKTKQMTFTVDENESLPKWYRDSSFFAFLSNRSDGKKQIYFMRPDGGEAWQVTNDKFGVSSLQWSKDGKYLCYLGGKPEERQIWIMPGNGGDAEKLTDHITPISLYLWSPNSKKIYFITPDYVDSLNKERKEKGFDVIIKDEIWFPSHLWEIDIETKKEKRLTDGNEYSVWNIEISNDGTKIAFMGYAVKRYPTYHDYEVYLFDTRTQKVVQITTVPVEKSYLYFSPDGKWLTFCMPNSEDGYYDLQKIYITSTEDCKVKKLLNSFDKEVPYDYFWSNDSKYIYFTTQLGVDFNLYRISIDNDRIEQITNIGGYNYFIKDEDSGKFFVSYSDPETPMDYYYSEPEDFNDRSKWIRLTDSNPQIKSFLLGKYETISWKSTDDTAIEGILIKPPNYKEGKRYPLIVQIHGGPADAYSNSFNDSYSDYVHVFSANDYVVFQPNYRGSAGYGGKFRKGILEGYFGLSFDDIMTGVNYLIKRGIVDPDRMGIMGWSAGGEFSNWALVSTDRFKAISTGAGGVNWISYYAQTDFQVWSEIYFTGTPYDKWEHYIKNSPLKYIKNAKTPTLIHFGEKDRRVPKPQGDELYMALKKLGVPTEFIVYPNTGHSIHNMRYQMVKMQAEFNWFEKWIKGKETWIDWKEMIETLQTKNKIESE